MRAADSEEKFQFDILVNFLSQIKDAWYSGNKVFQASLSV